MKRLVSVLMGSLLLAGSLSAPSVLAAPAAPRVSKAAFPLPVDSCQLYLTQRQTPDPDIIPQLLQGARVSYKPSRTNWQTAEIRYGTQLIKLRRVSDYGQVQNEKVSLSNLLKRLNVSQNPVPGLELEQKNYYLRQVVYITSSDPDDPDWPQLLSAIAQVWRGTLRYRNEMLDPRLRVLLAPANDVDPTSALAYFPSALARRERSERLLIQRKIPVYKNYPPSLAEEELVLRNSKDVLKRALVLMVLSSTSTTLTQTEGYNLLKKWGITHEISPKEWEYLRNPDLSAEAISYKNWEFESAYALFWALGLAPKATFPTEISDLKSLIKRVESRSFDQLYAQVNMRSPSQILDQLDLYQRMLWARAEQDKREWPELGIQPHVVLQWNLALLWLTSRDNWDDLSALRNPETSRAQPSQPAAPQVTPTEGDPVEELERELQELDQG